MVTPLCYYILSSFQNVGAGIFTHSQGPTSRPVIYTQDGRYQVSLTLVML